MSSRDDNNVLDDIIVSSIKTANNLIAPAGFGLGAKTAGGILGVRA